MAVRSELPMVAWKVVLLVAATADQKDVMLVAAMAVLTADVKVESWAGWLVARSNQK